jgi:crotonobetainyl-CoA:carnitine CoA-transferase CaiB-like acyl-CoA transferase
VELGIWVAVPSAAAILADWGATVVKIEPPTGDPLRGLAATGLVPYQPDVNPAFHLDNRGKRSVVLDLRRPEAQAVAHRLIADADVFLSNVRRQKLASLGLDYETLAAKNSRLVYASLSGYGSSGPDRDRAAFDYAAFWARAGIMASLGEPDGPPPTQRPGMGDHMTGLGLAGVVSAALLARERRAWGRRSGCRSSRPGCGCWRATSKRRVVDDPQAAALEAFAATELPDGRPLRVVKSPVDFIGTPGAVRGAAPEIGQHTEAMLLDIGYTWDEIGVLKDAGLLG